MEVQVAAHLEVIARPAPLVTGISMLDQGLEQLYITTILLVFKVFLVGKAPARVPLVPLVGVAAPLGVGRMSTVQKKPEEVV
jgi:hypothetical protein